MTRYRFTPRFWNICGTLTGAFFIAWIYLLFAALEATQ